MNPKNGTLQCMVGTNVQYKPGWTAPKSQECGTSLTKKHSCTRAEQFLGTLFVGDEKNGAASWVDSCKRHW